MVGSKGFNHKMLYTVIQKTPSLAQYNIILM